MKLKDLKISRQLLLGLGAILILVVLLGALAWYQMERMWQETEGLYNHPLTVRRAIGELTADILVMQRGMKDLLLAGNEPERQAILQTIDTAEANATRQFDILYDRYLGPRSDVDEAHTAFVEWRAIRAETLRLLQAGETAAAADRVKATGPDSAQVARVLSQLQDISAFALDRGDQFYLAAEQQREALRTQLGIVLGVILLLTLGIGYLLLKGINDPLRELTAVTEQYRQGQREARSRYVSANEFGELAASFNGLAETIEAEIQVKERVNQLAEVMLREDELHAFCQVLLTVLLEQTGSQIGAIYLLNAAKTHFEHFESIGLNGGGHAAFSATEREGEFGAALATRQIQRVADIPEDTRSRFVFSTVGGDFRPRDILTLPILSGAEVVALVSLASVRTYPAAAVRVVNDVWSVLTARLNGVLAFRQIHAFAEKLEGQNRELTAQAQELARQTDELHEQNIELEMQKRQLDEASRLKSAFLSNMSHELRTPLNSVIALSGVLSRRLRAAIPADEYSYLEVIERNGKNLLALINDILDLSRIEAGRDELNLTSFSVKALADEVTEMLAPQAREKNLILLNRVGEDLPPLTSDPVKCRHILQNLAGNAVKFTETGRVEISARRVDGDLHLVVSDTGIGIPADQLPYIFDEFRQVDAGAARKYGGTGLGLAIAHKYALRLGGTLTVESALGQGSTFTLRLPLTLSPPESAPASSGAPAAALEPPARLDGRGKRILLVEDSEPAVIQLLDILTGQGYQVQVARNGRDALEHIAAAQPDAMILDLMMPEVDGFQVLRLVRGAPKTARLPVLILTAKHVTREELTFLKGNHIQQLIQKGDVNREALLAAVARMVWPRAEAPADLPKPRRLARPRRAGKPVILVVEDNPDNRLTVRALLEAQYTLLEAADGLAGVELARTHQPDLILMDIALPVMDGIRALQAIRAEEALQPIPVIALTASAMKGSREEILAYGFDGYISKPIDTAHLFTIIKEFVEGG